MAVEKQVNQCGLCLVLVFPRIASLFIAIGFTLFGECECYNYALHKDSRISTLFKKLVHY